MSIPKIGCVDFGMHLFSDHMGDVNIEIRTGTRGPGSEAKGLGYTARGRDLAGHDSINDNISELDLGATTACLGARHFPRSG